MCQISGKALPLIVVVLWFRSFAFTVQILQASLLLIWTTERLAYLMQLGGVIIADSSIKKYLQDICFDHNPRTAAECGAPYDLHAPPKGVEARRLWLKALNLKKPPKFPYVCSFHFVDGRPTENHPFPEKRCSSENSEATSRQDISTNRYVTASC